MRILRLKEVIHLTGLSKTTIYDRMPKGEFPKAIPLGGRIVGWDEKAVQDWIATKLSNSQTPATSAGRA